MLSNSCPRSYKTSTSSGVVVRPRRKTPTGDRWQSGCTTVTQRDPRRSGGLGGLNPNSRLSRPGPRAMASSHAQDRENPMDGTTVPRWDAFVGIDIDKDTYDAAFGVEGDIVTFDY